MATPQQQIAGMQSRRARFDVRVEWLGPNVLRHIRAGMSARVALAAQLLRDRVVVNISRPVTKVRGANGKIRVVASSRSQPGEFPKADSTRLMTDIFWERTPGQEIGAVVGTTLDYGLVLETRRNRSFLIRTQREMLPVIRRILTDGRGGTRQLPGQE